MDGSMMDGRNIQLISFEGFRYRLTPGENGTASLVQAADGYDFVEIAQAAMTIDGQYVLYTVPRTALGIDGQDDFTLRVNCVFSTKSRPCLYISRNCRRKTSRTLPFPARRNPQRRGSHRKEDAESRDGRKV